MRYSTILRKPALLVLGLSAIAGVSASFASCASKPVVDVSLLDPEGLRAKPELQWAQLAIFAGGCPTQEDLAWGRVGAAVKIQTVEKMGQFSEIGDLDKGTFGFAVLLRQNDCDVFAAGCTPVDLEQHRHVTVQIGKYDTGYTACNAAKNEQCVAGLCSAPVPDAGAGGSSGDGGDGGDSAPTDGATDATTAKCDLTLIASDNLAVATEDGSNVAGPVVVATPSGFVILYREINSTGSKANAVKIPISDQGIQSARVLTAQDPCPTPGVMPNNRGIAAAWNTKTNLGMMCSATPGCTVATATETFIGSFDEKGETVAQKLFSPPDQIALAPSGGASMVPNDSTYYLAALVGKTPYIYTLEPTGIKSFEKLHASIDTASFAQVSASTGIVAATTDPEADGGGVALVVRSDQAAVDAGADADAAGPAINLLSEASIAALTTVAGRALAAVPTATGISYVHVDNTGKKLGSGALTGGTFLSLAASSLNSHAFIVGGGAKSLTLYRLDGADTVVSNPSVSINAKDPATVGTVSLAGYDGTTVAIASARKRVVVTWLSSKTGASKAKPVGGYAVFGCDG